MSEAPPVPSEDLSPFFPRSRARIAPEGAGAERTASASGAPEAGAKGRVAFWMVAVQLRLWEPGAAWFSRVTGTVAIPPGATASEMEDGEYAKTGGGPGVSKA